MSLCLTWGPLMIRLLFLIAAVSLAPLADVVGQAEPATVLARLRTGQTLRVRLHDGQRLQARLASVASEPPILRLAGRVLPIPPSTVDSLWVQGHATRTGALVGGIVLGAGSFALGAWLCSSFDQYSECSGSDWVAVAGFGLAGTGVGALLGAGLGSLVPKWRLAHPGRVALSLGPDRISPSAGARVQF